MRKRPTLQAGHKAKGDSTLITEGGSAGGDRYWNNRSSEELAAAGQFAVQRNLGNPRGAVIVSGRVDRGKGGGLRVGEVVEQGVFPSRQ